MIDRIVWDLLVVLFLVLANGFFVAAEFSLVTVRRTRIEQLANEGLSAAKFVRRAVQDLDRYIAGTQIGITIASLALGWVGEPALIGLIEPLFEPIGLHISEGMSHGISVGIAFTFITFLHVILGELVPKSLALHKPEETALALARPMSFAVKFFQPLIWSLNGLGRQLLRLIGLHTTAEHGSVHSPTELLLLIRQSHAAGHLDDFERLMLQKTFRFSEITVSEVMTPRSQIDGLNLNLDTEDVLDVAARISNSRLPVYEGSIDNIVGIVYTVDLLRLSRKKQGPKDLKSIMRNPLFVPESFHLDAMVGKFRDERTQIAVVIDEYGGTAGIITLEDVIETVFGEVQDHNEDPTPDLHHLYPQVHP
ncbi:MAG: hemolysin family protein [Proteobacteria bacterium]|nr:hemolysin family protein [Pseudomonadota bacterium]